MPLGWQGNGDFLVPAKYQTAVFLLLEPLRMHQVVPFHKGLSRSPSQTAVVLLLWLPESVRLLVLGRHRNSQAYLQIVLVLAPT